MGWEWSRAPASEDVIDGVEVGCSYGGNIGGGGGDGDTGACMRSEEVGRVPGVRKWAVYPHRKMSSMGWR
jgi:hypothetical protein